MPLNIFDLAADKLETMEKKKSEIEGNDIHAEEKENSYMLCFGSKASGKSSFILRFLDRDEASKPTIALEYTYGRRAKGTVKEVGHIWELGGGIFLLDLLKMAVSKQNISDIAFVLFVDLSKPETLWTVLEACIDAGRQAIAAAAERCDEQTKSHIKHKAWERVGKDHKDKGLIKPFPIPLAIVGGMYDVLQSNADPEMKKMICKTLRFVAHHYGACLQFFTTHNETLTTKGRVLASHLLFRTAASKIVAVDYNKPVFVPFGSDSFEDIGSPPVDNIQQFHATSPMDLWKQAYQSVFPQTDMKMKVHEDPSKDPEFQESTIDVLRELKDRTLIKISL